MRFAATYTELIELGVVMLGLFGLRLHISCNEIHCHRRELSPTGYCRKHQRQEDA